MPVPMLKVRNIWDAAAELSGILLNIKLSTKLDPNSSLDEVFRKAEKRQYAIVGYIWDTLESSIFPKMYVRWVYGVH